MLFHFSVEIIFQEAEQSVDFSQWTSQETFGKAGGATFAGQG